MLSKRILSIVLVLLVVFAVNSYVEAQNFGKFYIGMAYNEALTLAKAGEKALEWEVETSDNEKERHIILSFEEFPGPSFGYSRLVFTNPGPLVVIFTMVHLGDITEPNTGRISKLFGDYLESIYGHPDMIKDKTMIWRTLNGGTISAEFLILEEGNPEHEKYCNMANTTLVPNDTCMFMIFSNFK